ncbi:toll/interleukin-1 receptor domain-containing protein [Chryseobacterium paludis]|uniref:toll/interleukin-1 receptor domain-containing protein n=1 Tax=Chryseobacterium paludis TaxID=2956784 RepID=UPI0021C17D94|nr:toll/interleukin-1 receptor domain-containing protein [Chryseobacterium paludis]
MFKYQLILLGTITPLTEELVALYHQKIEELKLQKDFYKVIRAKEINEYKGNQPAFVIYFGDPAGNHKDIDEVSKMIDQGNMVLPIYYKQGAFRTEIPAILSNQNGLLFSNFQKDKIVDLVLESFGKLRNARKVFISYKRNESTSVAIQLYEALEKHNFDVFLDTHAIKQGEPFQEELWHRMTDCDVIVVLNTPGFMESEWCEKEIAEASVKQIGVIQLIWPNHKLERMAEVCFPTQLSTVDFINGLYSDKDKSKLTDQMVEGIVSHVESVRARNLASRQDNLITEFLNAARKNGKQINIQPERFLTEELPNSKRRIFIPLVGIPQSLDYNQSSELRKAIKDFHVEEVYLIYDDVKIRQKWLDHLTYLDGQLDVETIKKQEFDLWLQNH